MAVQHQEASQAESSAHAEQRNLASEEVNPSVARSSNSQTGETTQQQPPIMQPPQQPPPTAYALCQQQQQQQYPNVPGNGFNEGAVPTRILPAFNKAWAMAKLILSGFSVLFSILLIAISLGGFIGSPDMAGYSVVLILPIAGAGLLWEAAELITYWVRARHAAASPNPPGHPRGIHPVAHICLRLAWWILGIVAILSSILSIADYVYIYRSCDESSSSYWGYSSSWCDDVLASGGPGSSAYDSSLNMLRAIIAFWCLFTLVHFVLFVFACIDTARRNRVRRTAQIYYVPAPAGYYPQQTAVPATTGGPIQHPPAAVMAQAGTSDAEKVVRAPSTYYA